MKLTKLHAVFIGSLLWVAHGATCPPDPWEGYMQTDPIGLAILFVAAVLFTVAAYRDHFKEVISTNN